MFNSQFVAQWTPIDAALMIVGSQVTYILRFFLSRNIRIARDRAWDQTVASRGKGPEFWQPYVEEWEHPPRLNVESKQNKFIEKWLGGWFGLFVVKRGIIHVILSIRISKFCPSLALALPGVPFCGNGCDCMVQGPWYITLPSSTGKAYIFRPNFYLTWSAFSTLRRRK